MACVKVAASGGGHTCLLCGAASLLGYCAGLLKASMEVAAPGGRHFGLLLGGAADLLTGAADLLTGSAGLLRGGVNCKGEGGGERLTGGDGIRGSR